MSAAAPRVPLLWLLPLFGFCWGKGKKQGEMQVVSDGVGQRMGCERLVGLMAIFWTKKARLRLFHFSFRPPTTSIDQSPASNPA